ncbi:MAG: bifunctional adenosylcobinamide kinase/adenosylcobinamide-phosphate guanylyltransferase [Chloroflexota bacterium]|nr:bifunctional adenosylcobinamide kinase/adenosylcobinamide-phosphate guanylyltransferase [Chloroflexota bacterium]
MSRLTLVLGGVRAGKSAFALRLALRQAPSRASGRSQGEREGSRVLFVATAEAGDDEMAARIAAHRASRPAEWTTLEAPVDVVGALEPVVDGYDTVVLDCLTLWVSNLLLRAPDASAGEVIAAQAEELLALQERSAASWVVVSNEVGLGVIPPTELGRAFEDALGRVNQLFAAQADAVYFMAAGLPLQMKGEAGAGL